MKFKILDVEFDTRRYTNPTLDEDLDQQQVLSEEWTGQVIETVDDDFCFDELFKWFDKNTGWLIHSARLLPLDFENKFPRTDSEYWDYRGLPHPEKRANWYPDNFFRLQTIVVLPSIH